MPLNNFINELNNIFYVKGLIRFTLYVKIIDYRRKTLQEKY